MAGSNPLQLSAGISSALVIDLAVLAGATLFLSSTFGGASSTASETVFCLTVAILGNLLLAYCGAYRLRVLGSTPHELPRLAAAILSLAAFVGVMSNLGFGPARFAGILPGVSLGLGSLLGLTISRALLGHVLRGSWCRRKIVILGLGPLTGAIVRNLTRRAPAGFEITSILTDHAGEVGDEVAGSRVTGVVHELEKVLAGERVDCILVGSRRPEIEVADDSLLVAKLAGVFVQSGMQFLEEMNQRIYLDQLNADYLVSSEGFRPGRVYQATSRALDVVGSASLLLLTAPILLVAMAAIRLESPGGAIYGQVRVGRGGRHFRVRKLRSMREEAEDASGAVWAAGASDDRVTRVGRFLRSTRIDELPQLWNVLVGEMSLVGPRPERPEFIDELQGLYPFFSLRHTVRPGITGLAQIRQGYVADLESWSLKLSYDLYYVKHRSMWLDLQILIGTSRTVLLLRGI